MNEPEDDRLDERTEAMARDYHAPPPTPREEIWARIEAARRTGRPSPAPVIDIASRRRMPRWVPTVVAIAATLVLGVAIGRLTLPGTDAAPPVETVAATAVAPSQRAITVTRYAAIEHLSRVSTLLTDYQTGSEGAELPDHARSLLSRTRLLLDAPALEPEIRTLLEDLEVLLVQVAQLPPNGQGIERSLIDDNLAERAIRSRLRNAIPAGPAA
ncbi:MAG: hypothetical protein AB7L66_10525 [Gemmatimonadales bacterium]